MFQTEENIFLQIQKDNCWFTFVKPNTLPDIDRTADIMNDESLWNDDVLIQRHIFAMIFRGFGYSFDLKTALKITLKKLNQLADRLPTDKSFDSPEFANWLKLYAQYNILLGTIFEYNHMHTASAYHLMKGLKACDIDLFMPYRNFIEYVLSTVEKNTEDYAHYEGCGFSVDEPMGSPMLNGGTLNAIAGELIISELEGINGEIIISHYGEQKYGNLRRLGSTRSLKFRNCIDIYEGLIIDKNYNAKKINFYFNGYFPPQNRSSIRIPKDFQINPLSVASGIFKICKD